MKVTVYLDTDGWRWRLKAGNREIMASGEAYTRRHNAEKAVHKLFGNTDPVTVEVTDGVNVTRYTLRDVIARADLNRAEELENYAAAKGITLAEAINQLINSGLSHQPHLYLKDK